MTDNISESLTCAQIADAFSVSTGYVRHVFKELDNLTCKEYIIRQKMEYARKLLRHARAPIGDIAVQCGYDSFAYFSKVYRQTYGITPTAEREGNSFSANPET